MLLLFISLTLYFLSFILFLFKKDRISLGIFVIGSILNLFIIINEWIISNAPPFSSMHQVMILLGSCSVFAYLILVIRRKLYFLNPIFPLVAFLSILFSLFFDNNPAWQLAPALSSVWFVPHVISYMISYSLAFIAFILLLVAFASNNNSTKYDDACYETISLAFPLMTFGLLSGSLWANEVWGGYWSWDPKETWALITWTLYLIYFHLRKTKQLNSYANLAHILAFTSLVTTFILVNILPKLSSQLHSYV